MQSRELYDQLRRIPRCLLVGLQRDRDIVTEDNRIAPTVCTQPKNRRCERLTTVRQQLLLKADNRSQKDGTLVGQETEARINRFVRLTNNVF